MRPSRTWARPGKSGPTDVIPEGSVAPQARPRSHRPGSEASTGETSGLDRSFRPVFFPGDAGTPEERCNWPPSLVGPGRHPRIARPRVSGSVRLVPQVSPRATPSSEISSSLYPLGTAVQRKSEGPGVRPRRQGVGWSSGLYADAT